MVGGFCYGVHWNRCHLIFLPSDKQTYMYQCFWLVPLVFLLWNSPRYGTNKQKKSKVQYTCIWYERGKWKRGEGVHCFHTISESVGEGSLGMGQTNKKIKGAVYVHLIWTWKVEERGGGPLFPYYFRECRKRQPRYGTNKKIKGAVYMHLIWIWKAEERGGGPLFPYYSGREGRGSTVSILFQRV